MNAYSGVFRRYFLTLALAAFSLLCFSFTKSLAQNAVSKPQFSTLHAFYTNNNHTAPVMSHADLIDGKDGALYGFSITQGPGDKNLAFLFRVKPNSKATVLAKFHCASDQLSKLTKSQDGSIYGAAFIDKSKTFTLFKIDIDGIYNLIKIFDVKEDGDERCSLCASTDGGIVGAFLLQKRVVIFHVAQDRTFKILENVAYTGCITQFITDAKDSPILLEVDNDKKQQNTSSINRILPGGDQRLIGRFVSPKGSDIPLSFLFSASDGRLYGVTNFDGDESHGSLFSIGIDDDFKTVCRIRRTPRSDLLVLDNVDKNGRAIIVNCNMKVNGSNSIYFATSDGKLSPLITSDGKTGPAPQNILLDPVGALYGTTADGGDFGHGSIIQINPDNQVETLYSFTGKTEDGGRPDNLILGGDGNLYGTTAYNGNAGCGTVFMLETGAKK